jgi:glycosyltransferase involved in cell wall biosynthesis
MPPLASMAEARRSLGLPESALVVTLVARLVRWKGHAVFLRALAELVSEYPQVHGLMLGGSTQAEDQPGPLAGGAGYERELLGLLDSLHLAGRVTMLGHTDETAPVFSASDIVAHTSILPEPFGRVIIEAMAAGRPVVASAAGGPREIVQDGLTGWLTPPGDSAALAAAVRRLVADAELRDKMGMAGRRRAETEYSLPIMAERFMAVWGACASPRRSG